MTTYINTDESVIENNNIHFVPCSIDHNGRASVSSYFQEKELSDGVKIASFRGRPLLGSEMHLPQEYCGYVVHKTIGTQTESRVFDVRQTFKKINYWNLDRMPSQNDIMQSALEWIDFANVIHKRINPEDISKESTVNTHNGNSDNSESVTK